MDDEVVYDFLMDDGLNFINSLTNGHFVLWDRYTGNINHLDLDPGDNI